MAATNQQPAVEEQRIDWRRWDPIPDRRLAEIVRDTAKDDPAGYWTVADVYRIAAELLKRRKEQQ